MCSVSCDWHGANGSESFHTPLPQNWVKRMIIIAVDVQRTRNRPDDSFFHEPRIARLLPTDQGVLIQPTIEPLLSSMRQGHPLTATNALERKSANVGEENAKGPAKR